MYVTYCSYGVNMTLKSVTKDIIQGGMGVGVSNYRLARAVSTSGELGVVSGVALENVMLRRLQNGDPTGEIRFALKHFPDHELAELIIDKYYIPEGKKYDQNYLNAPFPTFKNNSDGSLSIKNSTLTNLIVAANFVEVYLAKQGHSNPVGINYLYKIRYSMMPAVYGAMLAGVDCVLIGAGFAKDIPDAITSLSEHNSATLSIPIVNGNDQTLHFNPEDFFMNKILSKVVTGLKRPAFFGILSNHMGIRALPNADAYIFEGFTAGGHNAPARSKALNAIGEPDYGAKDEMDFSMLKMLLNQNAQKSGKLQPYWLAGAYAAKLQEAKELGASGIQVGSPFAFSSASGIEKDLKLQTLKEIMNGGKVFTSPDASSSGFPFKVFQNSNTLSNLELYNARERVCDLGYLVELYNNKGDTRCPSENISQYIRKGGLEKDTVNKVCLCNALLATIGLGSLDEIAIVTTGSDLSSVKEIVNKYGLNYSAKNVIDYILEKK